MVKYRILFCSSWVLDFMPRNPDILHQGHFLVKTMRQSHRKGTYCVENNNELAVTLSHWAIEPKWSAENVTVGCPRFSSDTATWLWAMVKVVRGTIRFYLILYFSLAVNTMYFRTNIFSRIFLISTNQYFFFHICQPETFLPTALFVLTPCHYFCLWDGLPI